MHERIAKILSTAHENPSRIRPTELYNEGWMLRLLLDWVEAHPESNHKLSLRSGARWYSEALLPSQFKGYRGLGEGWTSADGVVGHFDIGCRHKGALTLAADASQFVVIEAKMFSPLSSGTKNAPDYNQAARNVACIAQVLKEAQRTPDSVESALAFYVVAPQEQIEDDIFRDEDGKDIVEREAIRRCVEQRVESYKGRDATSKRTWFEEWFTPTIEVIKLELLSWEDLIRPAGSEYEKFYQRCRKFNKPGSPRSSIGNQSTR